MEECNIDSYTGKQQEEEELNPETTRPTKLNKNGKTRKQ